MHAGLGRGRRLCRARALLSPKAFGFGAKNNSGHGTGGSFALGCKYHIAIGELAVNLSMLLSCCLVGTRGCSSQGAEQGRHPQGHPQPCPSWSRHFFFFFLIFFQIFFFSPSKQIPQVSHIRIWGSNHFLMFLQWSSKHITWAHLAHGACSSWGSLCSASKEALILCGFPFLTGL